MNIRENQFKFLFEFPNIIIQSNSIFLMLKRKISKSNFVNLLF